MGGISGSTGRNAPCAGVVRRPWRRLGGISAGSSRVGVRCAAGAQAFADPGSGIAYGYVRRRFAFPGGAAPENERLAAAVVRAAAGV